MGADWAAIRVEYVHGTATMRELAEAHGINHAGLMKRAMEEGWNAERQQRSAKVVETASAALQDSRAATLAKFNADDVKIARGIKGKIARMLAENKLSPQDLRALAGALDSAQKVGRLALGASTENAAVSVNGEVRIAQSSELDALSPDELRDLLRITRKVGARDVPIEMET